MDGAAAVHVVAGGDDVAIHVGEVGGDGHFVHGVGGFAILDPDAGGAAGVVAGHAVDPLPHEMGDHEPRAHLAHQVGRRLALGLHF